MITIHCTKKLFARLAVDAQGYLPPQPRSQPLLQKEQGQPSLLGSWHANLLTIQRRNCVLLVHDQTRFPLFIPALVKKDFSSLEWWFDDALMNTLLKCGANDQQMEKAWQQIHRLQFDTVCNRSVQGTLNRMGQEIEHALYYDEVNVADITGYRLSARLAERPCNIKGRKDCVWPKQAFMALVDALPLNSGPTEQRDNLVDLASFRK